MGFDQAVAVCFRKYAVFEGRAQNAEYWWFTLFQLLVSCGLQFLLLPYRAAFLWQLSTPGLGRNGAALSAVALAVDLVFLLPTLAVTVRRLHDLDRSGWWMLLGGVPVAGWAILFVWVCKKGTMGANRFGADPLLPISWARGSA